MNEGLAALVADIGTVAGVRQLVFSQHALDRVTFSTSGAHKRPLVGVDTLMKLKVNFYVVSLFTVLTGKWSESSVHEHMLFHLPFFDKTCAAFFTFKLLYTRWTTT